MEQSASLGQVQTQAPAKAKGHEQVVTTQVNSDKSNESDESIWLIQETGVSEDEDESAGSDKAGQSAVATEALEADYEVTKDLAAIEKTACGSKKSLGSFERLTSVRIQASGADQYLVSVDGNSSAILRAAVRDSIPGERCCSGSGGNSKVKNPPSNRSFAIDVSTYAGHARVVRVVCDQHGSATVDSPPGEVIGYITAERVVCSLWFTIRDLHGAAKLIVKGNRYCDRQAYVGFRILLPDESAEVAKLEWAIAESATATYTIEMPETMGSDVKAMLLAVAMLFDRKLFSQS